MNKCSNCNFIVEKLHNNQLCYTCFRKKERERNRIYHAKNKEQINAKRAKLKQGRQPEINAYQRDQYNKNHSNYRSAINKRYNERYNNDTEFRLSKSLKRIMLNYFNKNGRRTFEFIGCTRDMFLDWLKWQCDIVGLNFNDHGNIWHIDHVIPCTKFNLTQPDQQKLCFNWTNLRPLLAAENISKSNTIDLEAIRVQEIRYRSYLFINKNFDRTNLIIGTVLTTTICKQLHNGTRGNDLGNISKSYNDFEIKVKTSETWGQSAAKLLQMVLNLEQKVIDIQKNINNIMLVLQTLEEGSETKRRSIG